MTILTSPPFRKSRLVPPWLHLCKKTSVDMSEIDERGLPKKTQPTSFSYFTCKTLCQMTQAPLCPYITYLLSGLDIWQIENRCECRYDETHKRGETRFVYDDLKCKKTPNPLPLPILLPSQVQKVFWEAKGTSSIGIISCEC